MDILDLTGWRLLEAPLDGEGYRLVAEFLAEPDTCQRCGVIGRLYRHGTHATTYRDSPIRGHQSISTTPIATPKSAPESKKK